MSAFPYQVMLTGACFSRCTGAASQSNQHPNFPCSGPEHVPLLPAYSQLPRNHQRQLHRLRGERLNLNDQIILKPSPSHKASTISICYVSEGATFWYSAGVRFRNYRLSVTLCIRECDCARGWRPLFKHILCPQQVALSAPLALIGPTGTMCAPLCA